MHFSFALYMTNEKLLICFFSVYLTIFYYGNHFSRHLKAVTPQLAREGYLIKVFYNGTAHCYFNEELLSKGY